MSNAKMFKIKKLVIARPTETVVSGGGFN